MLASVLAASVVTLELNLMREIDGANVGVNDVGVGVDGLDASAYVDVDVGGVGLCINLHPHPQYSLAGTKMSTLQCSRQ